MSIGLTPRQNDLFGYLLERDFESRVAPSLDEMKAHLGVRSKSTVHRLVEGLVERGLIRRLPGRARAIEVVRRAEMSSLVLDPLPEVRRAITLYAADNSISEKVAAEEALRAYFVGAAP